ncbi:hypothetical protein GALL_133640 [mine drainage metagenome]|uniref:Uncharacterized protein n=1 Tax=mine drainage metagenome TaxID=410659 RepID=A0A1J5S7I3_9ZZZZ
MNNINNLKRSLFATLALIALAVTPAVAADVGVSVSIGQPGFYGRLDIGDYPYPQPSFIYREPIIVHRSAGVMYEPLYLRVPPGQVRRWSHYCDRYNACGRPVYFVQDRWYNEVYVPQYHERHGGNEWRDNDRGRDGGWRDNDRGRDNRHDNERGRGHDRGHGRD